MANIYINLPVKNVPQATQFYETLWFTKNPHFSNEDASSMMYDDNLIVMLLSHDFTKNFLPEGRVIADSHKTCEVLNAIQFDSKEAVDTFFEKVVKAWGTATIPTYDMWFMYGRDFQDLDWHIWEAFWMDPAGMPTGSWTPSF